MKKERMHLTFVSFGKLLFVLLDSGCFVIIFKELIFKSYFGLAESAFLRVVSLSPVTGKFLYG